MLDLQFDTRRPAAVAAPAASMTSRFHVAGSWREGDLLALPPNADRHVRVLRMQAGDPIVLFDGKGDSEWGAEIARIGRDAVEVRIGRARHVSRELPVAVTLAFGMAANDRMDTVVEKATELGAAWLQPLVCARSVLRLVGERAETRRAHWHGVAAAAAEQCGRTRVPQVGVPMRFAEWIETLEAGGERWLLSLDGHARPPSMPATDAAGGRGITALSGPEGGLSADEKAAAERAGFVAVSLGPRVLRADTAPLALLAWLGVAATASSS